MLKKKYLKKQDSLTQRYSREKDLSPVSQFTQIDQNSHSPQHSRIESLLEILRNTQDFDLSEKEKKLATFLIADNAERQVYGGAVLLKRKILNASKGKESTYAFQGEALWTCSFGLSLINKNLNLMSKEEISFANIFYEKLYERLVVFSNEKETSFLWVTLDAEEAVLLEKIGNFPFVFQLKSQHTADGLFHGLLVLKEDLAKPFLNTRHWGKEPSKDLKPLSVLEEN